MFGFGKPKPKPVPPPVRSAFVKTWVVKSTRDAQRGTVSARYRSEAAAMRAANRLQAASKTGDTYHSESDWSRR